MRDHSTSLVSLVVSGTEGYGILHALIFLSVRMELEMSAVVVAYCHLHIVRIK